MGKKKVAYALRKHFLLFDKAFAFFADSLQKTNTFSEEALRIITEEEGEFFTLLPDHANLDNLHHFSISILTPESKKRGPIGNLPGVYTYSLIASMEKEFAFFLYEQMYLHAYQFMCDDFNATYEEGTSSEWFNLFGANHGEETYYFLAPHQATPELIEQCLTHSKTFWHSLCILSRSHFANKTIQLSEIQKFCRSAEFILVGAYDGEGYIVWQKK